MARAQGAHRQPSTAGKKNRETPTARQSAFAQRELPENDLHELELIVLKLDATRAAARIILEQIGEPRPGGPRIGLLPEHAGDSWTEFMLAQRVRMIINEQERSALQDLFDATPVRRLSPARADLERKAIEAVLSGTEWLTAQEVGQRQNPDATNQHAVASRWKKEGKVFFIEHKGVTLYPKYIFDEFGNPVSEVAEVLKIFQGYRPFRIASWFESTSSMLRGKRPREVLGTDPKAVVEAARDQVVGPVHG
ncbi:hypothetical protein [Caballeronia sp. 15715]|uniref:hypothetical protein n=1 Tax=unclassified Caballeronia TaxID=2646786 RepID=UPI0039E49CB6